MQGRISRFVAALGLSAIFVSGYVLADFTATPDTHPDQLWVTQPQHLSAYAPYADEIRASLPAPVIRHLAADRARGIVWVIGNEGLFAVSPQGSTIGGPFQLPLAGDDIVGLLPDSESGNVWVVHRNGWLRYDELGALQNAWDGEQTVHDARLGLRDGRLLLLAGEELLTFDAAGVQLEGNTLPFRATKLALDPQTYHVWLISDDEVLRYDYKAFPSGDSLPAPLSADHVQADGSGGLWMADKHRLVRINAGGETVVDVLPWFQQPGGGNAAIVALAAHPGEQSAWVVNVQRFRRVNADGTLGPAQELAHPSALRSAVLHADYTPPELAILAPGAEDFTNNNQPDIRLAYSDYGSVVATDSIDLSWNDAGFAFQCVADEASADCLPLDELEDGYHTLAARVADLAGNLSERAEVRFTIDTVPPTITVLAPEEGTHTRETEIEVRGNVDEMPVTLEIQDQVTPVQFWQFRDDVPLPEEGENRISLKATDRAGNSSWETLRVIRDTTPPRPPNGISVVQNGDVIEVIGAPGSVDPYAHVDVFLEPAGFLRERELNLWQQLLRLIAGTRADANGSFHLVIDEPGLDWRDLRTRITDRAGNESDYMPLPEPEPDRRDHPVGRVAGELSVDPTGAANYRIPIKVPKGAGGMQPDLALLYSSRAGNGHLGIGWSLSGLSAITRCAKTIAQDGVRGGIRYDGNDRFCLDGQRLVKHGSGSYGASNVQYRTEIESFQKVVSLGSSGNVPGRFEVRDKAGLIRHYGATTDSRIRRQGTSIPLMWAVSKIEDRNGNYIAFSYEQNTGANGNGEHYPTEISWHNRHGVRIGRVVLDYGSRPDRTEGRVFGGSRTALTRRLAKVTVYSGVSERVRYYELAYEQAPLSGASLLASVRLCAFSGACLPATQLGWKLPKAAAAHRVLLTGADSYTMADIDGDGLTDWITASEGGFRIRLGKNPHDYFDTGIEYVRDDGYCEERYGGEPGLFLHCRDMHTLSIQAAIAADVDGDGYQDLLVPQAENRHYWLLRSTGSTLEIHNETALPHGKSKKDDLVAVRNAVIDLDGDGKSEILARNDGSLQIAHFVNGVAVLTDTGIDLTGQQNVHVFEADGDGRPDIYISGKTCSGGGGGGGGGGQPPVVIDSACSSAGAWLYTGNGFERPDYSAPVTEDPVFVDANGDGLTDILRKEHDGWTLYNNTGSGWEDTGWRGEDWSHKRLRTVDWNGDGRQDLMVSESKGDWNAPNNTVWTVRVSDGTGFGNKQDSGFSNGATGKNSYSSAQFMDLTGDGVFDMFFHGGENGYRVLRGTGVAQPLLNGIVDGYGMETAIGYTPLSVPGEHYIGHTDAGLEDEDRDSLNIRDFVAPLPVVRFFAQDTGRVAATGAAVKVVSSYQYKGAKVDIHGRGFLGFAEVRASNANTGIHTVNHHQQSFPFTGSVRKSEQRLPPEGTPLEDIDNGALRDDFFPPCPGQQPQLAAFDDCDLHPFTVNTQIAHGENTPGQIVSRTVTAMKTRKAGNTRIVWTDSTTEREYDLNSGDLIRRVRTAYDYDDHGNATLVDVRTDNGAGNDLHRVRTENTYTDDTSRWLLGRLATATVRHFAPGTGSITRRAAYEYDPATGQLTRETLEPGDPNLELVTAYAHDEFGNVTGKTVSGNSAADYPIGSRTSTTVYGTKGVHPVSVSNALDHTETYTWDARFGSKLSATGPNGLTTRWEYDDFGRVAAEISPRTALRTTTQRNWCGGGTDCYSEAAEIRVYTATTTGATKVVELDRLGREVLRRTSGLDNELIATETWYDLLGRAYLVSEPYRLDENVVCYRFREYDTLNRVIKEHRPANDAECDQRSGQDVKLLYDHEDPPSGYSAVTAFDYEGLTTTVTPPQVNGHSRVVRRSENVAGRLLDVTEWDDAGTALHTVFAYNATGETIGVTPPSGHAITLGYDRRGRKTFMHDPDMGHWQYTHNALGELVRQEDAKGQVTTLEYDVLGRMIRRSEPEGDTVWAYDTAPGKGLGKLAVVRQHDGFEEAYRYTGFGEIDTQLKITGEFAWFTRNTYNSLGQLEHRYLPAARDIPAENASINNPDITGSLRLTHHYSDSGKLKAVHRTDGDRDESIWQAEDLTARGQLRKASLGNDLANYAEYDAANGLVIEHGVGPAESGNYTVQYHEYHWDIAGNLVSRQDVVNEITETFQYDRLHRLTRTGFTAGGYTASRQFAYDNAGNIKRNGNLRNYQYGEGAYGGTRPHAVIGIERFAGGQAVDTFTYRYDANGNAEDVNGRIIEWSSFNKPTRIDNNGAYSSFAYGPDRARYRHEKRYSNGDIESTLYAGATERIERTMDGITGVEYRQSLQAGGQVVATVKTFAATGIEQTRYLHRDHLGSIALITSDTGKVIEQHAFTAWGASRRLDRLTNNPWRNRAVAELATSRGFTGHEMLDHLGLIHMNGRIYDPEIGRFLSADPFVQFPHSTQGYNRYSYLNNNPLNATDPSGYFNLKKELGRALSNIAPLLNFVPGCQLWCATLASAVGGYLQTGSVQVGLRAGAFTLAGSVMALGTADIGNIGLKALVSGVAGGVISKAGGGRFGDGFLGGMVGSFAASAGLANTGNMAGDMIVGAIVGGSVAVIGGGKFKNGATSGAFAAAVRHMQANRVTDASNPSDTDQPARTQEELDDLVSEVYDDYPELEKYRKTIEAVATLPSDGGKEVAGEWVSQDKIQIATAGRTDAEIKGTVLHELLHVDAAEHTRFGNRILYRFTVVGHNHPEIRQFQTEYYKSLIGEPYANANMELSYSAPSLENLSWRGK